MYSLEKLKELAVNQMRAAANLYEVCEKAEKELKDLKEDNDTYIKFYLRVQCNYRYELLKHLFELTPTMEEKDLWDEIT